MTAQILPHDLIGTGSVRVIVLHGWLGDRTAFDAMRPYLDTASFSYAFLDYRGFGEARDLDGEHDMREATDDVLATADALGWDEFSIIGHSMSGAVAQHVLLAAPDRVRSIVGISPVPASGVPFDDAGRTLFAEADQQIDNRRAIIDLTTGGRLPGAWLDAMVDRSVRRTDPTAFRRWLDSWSQTDVSAQIDGNTTPVLVIAGAHDPALSEAVMRSTWMRWYPNAELEVFADAGHYAPDEVPLALTAACERFLRG